MKQTRTMWFLLALSLLFSVFTLGAYAQNSGSQSPGQYPPNGAQSPSQQPGQTPGQMPDQTAPPSQQPGQQSPDAQSPASAPDASGAQMFSGTIVKNGDKYMLQDSASGKSYDIDHQEQVKNYEGKRVRVKGTLDSSTNTIHIQ